MENMIEAEEGKEGGEKYVAQLEQIAIQGKWRTKEGNWGVPADNAPACGKRPLSGGDGGGPSSAGNEPEPTPGAKTRSSSAKQTTEP